MRRPARPAPTPLSAMRRWCSWRARVPSIRGVLLIGVFLLAACSSPGPGAAPNRGPSTERLGVGGVATPAGAVLTTEDSTEPLKIRESGSEGSPRVYDGQGHTVGTIEIRADWVVVQNFKVQATGQYGFDAKGTHVTIQNNDIKGVHASGNGDLNAITFDGDYTSIRNNTAIDFVSGDSGDSHTDGIQTWNDDPGESSSHVLIQGNYFSGPLEDDHSSYIHQCVMSEGAESTDGGGGGTGDSRDWLIVGNYCVGDMKFDDIDNVTVTGNEFAGVDKRTVVVTPLCHRLQVLLRQQDHWKVRRGWSGRDARHLHRSRAGGVRRRRRRDAPAPASPARGNRCSSPWRSRCSGCPGSRLFCSAALACRAGTRSPLGKALIAPAGLPKLRVRIHCGTSPYGFSCGGGGLVDALEATKVGGRDAGRGDRPRPTRVLPGAAHAAARSGTVLGVAGRGGRRPDPARLRCGCMAAADVRERLGSRSCSSPWPLRERWSA